MLLYLFDHFNPFLDSSILPQNTLRGGRIELLTFQFMADLLCLLKHISEKVCVRYSPCGPPPVLQVLPGKRKSHFQILTLKHNTNPRPA